MNRVPRFERRAGHWRGSFEAMASPCELLFRGGTEESAQSALAAAASEVWRIEAKFSRYRDDNVVHALHAARGRPVRVDAETALLLDFAQRAYELSHGTFDATSGLLGAVWNFDGADGVPDPQQIAPLLERIGWHRVTWEPPVFTLPEGMEIDFGGFGKEYAVDRAADLVSGTFEGQCLINFGGDLRAVCPEGMTEPWSVGVEHPDRAGTVVDRVPLVTGALATSGDARRYAWRDGVRYGHILDPRTGYPVADAPRAVTVQASTASEAGLLSTLGVLAGAHAEAFLQAQDVTFWCIRDDTEPA